MSPLEMAEIRREQRLLRGVLGSFIVAVLASLVVVAPIAMAGGFGVGSGGLQGGSSGGASSGGAGTFSNVTITAASGADGINMLDGAHLNLSTADARAYLVRSASNLVGVGGSFRTGAGATGSGVADMTVFGDFYAGLSANFSVAYASRALTSDGSIHTTSTLTTGSCTLNGGSPSTCTATVVAGCKPGCFATGTTAAAGLALAASIATTTLTCTGPNASTAVVNYICL